MAARLRGGRSAGKTRCAVPASGAAPLRRAAVLSLQMRRWPGTRILFAPPLFVMSTAIAGTGLRGQAPDAAPALTASSPAQSADAFAALLQRIRPAADELAFLAVPWRTELRTALVEGDAQDKPVLLWAMNGHPLGQT